MRMALLLGFLSKMATGKQHETASKVMAVICFVGVGVATQEFTPALLAGAGSLSGIFLTPDLDVDTMIRSHKKLIKKSWLIGWLWRMYWKPYAKLIKHRHWTSHAPGIGTAIRLLYLLAIPLCMAICGKIDVNIPEWGIWAFLGLFFSDLAHWLMDR